MKGSDLAVVLGIIVFVNYILSLFANYGVGMVGYSQKCVAGIGFGINMKGDFKGIKFIEYNFCGNTTVK